MLAGAHLGSHHEQPFSQQWRTRAAGQFKQVLGNRGALIPPGEIQRRAARDPVHPCPVRGGQVWQHQGRLVRAELMQQQRQVEPAVQRRPVLAHFIDRPDRRTGEDDPQLGVLVNGIEKSTKNPGQGRRRSDQLREFVEDE